MSLYCASCTQPIPDHEPDLVLEDLSTGRRRYFHAFSSEGADCFWRLVEA